MMKPGQRVFGGKQPKDEIGPSARKRERLLAMIERRAPDECWPWKGSCNNHTQRGQFFWDDKKISSSRAAYLLLVGPVPDDLHVCHRCDNPPCCNLAHLFLGTPRDNMHDMVAKGRNILPDTVGEANSAAKLTEGQVFAIRASRDTGVALAARYGVSTTAISDIRVGKTWAHLLYEEAA